MTKESSLNRPRRFAPLKPEKQIEGEDLGPRLKGIVFDVDGTLCECFLSSFYSIKCCPSSFWGYGTAFYLFSHIKTPRFSLVVGNLEWLEEAQYFSIFLEWIRQVKVSKTVVKPITIYKKQCSIYAFSFEFGS